MAHKNKKLNNDATAPAKKKNIKSIIFNILYYGLLAVLVVGIFLLSNINGGSQVRTYGGYAAFTVLSGSMQSVYPKDSLIVTKAINGQELNIGDDITYIANETTVVTHRIIEIIENGNGKGGRSFRTKGVNNPNPDSYQVYEENVVGKVIYSNYFVGRMLIFISKQWPIILFLVAVFAGLGIVLNKILADDKTDGKEMNLENVQQQVLQETQPQTMQPVLAQELPKIITSPETATDGRRTVVVTINPQKGGKPDKGKAPIIIEIISTSPTPVIIQTPDAVDKEEI